ncbi:MAG: DegQ family serine endoprotease [Proteobacteria bacterium]|nr:DegQ family serine endoprotease [Pseudomonadota bacterium]
MSHESIAPRLVSVVLAVTLLTGCAPQASTAAPAAPQAPAAANEPPAATAVPATPLVRNLPDFANLVAQVGPAVVNVTVVEKRQRVQGFSNPFSDDNDPFSDFFRQFQNRQPRNQPPEEGVGSGFIVSPDGYILTNTHVVDNATRVTVRLTDRREFQAKVIGSDDKSDVALLKIEAKNLPTVRIGDPSKLRPGEWVIAIGSPFNFQNSVTAGIVSALGRPVPGSSGYNYVNFIQTDVAVNPGNSGGPLFNMNGEVVGINSQIYSNTGSYAGLSFAIPIDIANNVRLQLAATGHVTRGRIGVAIQPVTAALAESFGLDRPRGAAVSSVDAGGPADKAGLKPEDIILGVNGRKIEQSSELPEIIAGIKPGNQADLEIWRGQGTRHIPVIVEELKDKGSVSRTSAGGKDSDKLDALGLSVRELSAAEKSQLHTTGSVVITDTDGPSAEAGLRAGEVILGANRTRVGSVAELREAVRKAGRSIALLVQSYDPSQGVSQQRIVTVQLD